MRWIEGRQGTGYRKWTLLALPRSDIHILRYDKGHYIPPHVDKVPSGLRHYRMNILLYGEDTFKCSEVIFKKGPVVLFRPDLHEHSVSPVSRLRIVLSLGFALKEKSDGQA